MDLSVRGVFEELFKEFQLVTHGKILRLELGESQREAAAAIGAGVDEDYVRDCERRRRNPKDEQAVALCARFGVTSVALLGFGRAKESARWWTWMKKNQKEFLVNRREMLKSGAAAVALIPVSDLVYSAQVIGRLRGYVVCDGDVDFAQETATELAKAYAANPDADACRAARSHALTLMDLLKPCHTTIKLPDTRRRLQAVASDACALAGYGDLNAGRLDRADRWFRGALALAREAGDRRLEAFALAAKAWIPLSRPEQDHAAVLAALQAAATFQTVLRPAGRAYVFAYLSRESAANGEDLASGRFLEQARAAGAYVPWDDPGWGLWSTYGELGKFDGGRVESFAGCRLSRLGRPAEALLVFEQNRKRITRPIGRIGLLEEEMLAYAALGEIEGACVSAIAALEECKAHGVFVHPRVLTCRDDFPVSAGTLPLVRELNELLRLAA